MIIRALLTFMGISVIIYGLIEWVKRMTPKQFFDLLFVGAILMLACIVTLAFVSIF